MVYKASKEKAGTVGVCPLDNICRSKFVRTTCQRSQQAVDPRLSVALHGKGALVHWTRQPLHRHAKLHLVKSCHHLSQHPTKKTRMKWQAGQKARKREASCGQGWALPIHELAALMVLIAKRLMAQRCSSLKLIEKQLVSSVVAQDICASCLVRNCKSVTKAADPMCCLAGLFMRL